MQPGDLVRHRGNKKVYLIRKTREFEGEVIYVHLVGMPDNNVYYLESLELVQKA